MEKTSALSSTENTSDKSLEGVYRVVVDLKVQAGKNVTLADLKDKIGELGGVSEFFIEKYAEEAKRFAVGDTIMLAADISCTKCVYADANGNIVITDRPIPDCMETLGEFDFSLPQGCVAEVNRVDEDGEVEILFSGETVEVEELAKNAYLGILKLPSSAINRYA